MFRGFIWDQKLYTAIVTAMTLHYIIDRWRTMTISTIQSYQFITKFGSFFFWFPQPDRKYQSKLEVFPFYLFEKLD